MTEPSLAALPPAGAVHQVLQVLETLVVEHLQPGALLPAEADLAARHGVSRLTVREALKVLAGRGLVELRRGRRSMVRQPDSSMLSAHFSVALRRDPLAVLELTEVRQALEVQGASLAATRASRADVAEVEGAYQQMVGAAALPAPEGVEAYHRADIAFHESLARASGNRMLAFLLQGLEEALLHSFDRSLQGHVARGRRVGEVLGAHRLVLDGVRDGDAAAAARAMRDHLHDAERDLRAALRGTTEGGTTEGSTR